MIWACFVPFKGYGFNSILSLLKGMHIVPFKGIVLLIIAPFKDKYKSNQVPPPPRGGGAVMGI